MRRPPSSPSALAPPSASLDGDPRLPSALRSRGPRALRSRGLRGALALGALLTLGVSACSSEDTIHPACANGEPGCQLESPCARLPTASCSGDLLSIVTLEGGEGLVRGPSAQAAKGDVVLSSGRVTATIAGVGNQYHLAPNGGSILDLATTGHANDAINEIFFVTGVLPDDSARYTSMRLIDERPNRVAVQVNGHLDGRPEVRVYTLYELRACEPGLRVRTEIINASAEENLFLPGDVWFWGQRGPLPFAPTPGAGFDHPSFGLTDIDSAVRPTPMMSASLHSPTPDGSPRSSYAVTACNTPVSEGVHSVTLSLMARPRVLLSPREHTVYDRFIAVVPGDDAAAAGDVVMEVREQLFDEPWVTVSGTVAKGDGGDILGEQDASVLLIEGGPQLADEERTPWAQVVPNEDGSFSARVPAGKDLTVEVHTFGQARIERGLGVVSADEDAGTFTLPSTARLSVEVEEVGSGAPIHAQLFVISLDETSSDDSGPEAIPAGPHGDFHGVGPECAPWLGAPAGSSPACNRVLVTDDGPAQLEVPVGNYEIYAFHGPFWTVERQTVELDATDHSLTFTLAPLPLRPTGTIDADMHIHGAASFDSTMPDVDRVLSFAASDLQVAMATDHDAIYDYAPTVSLLGLEDTLSTVVGIETSGWIPYLYTPGYDFPLVIGHYNFWPLNYRPELPKSGGPHDEFQQPGQLFDRMVDEGIFAGPEPVIQLNHPWIPSNFGRDLGFPKAIKVDATRDLPAEDDGTPNGLYVAQPGGGHSNADHDVQEVLNGVAGIYAIELRAFWFYLLNQGHLKVGTANSDSHYLSDGIVGMPRTVVWADTAPGPSFDLTTFNQSLKAGRAFGTSGPVIEAWIEDSAGRHDFGMTPFTPAPGAQLHVSVRAAPWIPVEEVRVVVNGRVVELISGDALSHPADPFGTTGLDRYTGVLLLDDLLDGLDGDAWLLVEAGSPFPLSGDLGGGIGGARDGIPDTTDNDGDGDVDADDVAAGSSTGPIVYPVAPPEDDRGYVFGRLSQGVPQSFTNPFILDRDGSVGFDAPGVGGGWQ